MAKYKIGVIKKLADEDRYIASCSCRTVRIIGTFTQYRQVSKDITCERCGNKKFIKFDYHAKRVVIPYLEALSKSEKGFKVKRTNLSIIIDDEYNLSFKKNQIQVMSYDLVNNEIKIWKNGIRLSLGDKIKSYPDIDNYRRFFHQINDKEFIDVVKTEYTESLFEMAWKELSEKNWHTPKKIYRGLVNLFDYKHIQILANAGYPNLSRFKERVYYSSSRVLDSNATKPKDIFKLPKFLLKFIRENQNVGIYEIQQMQKALKKVETNRFMEIFEIVKDEGGNIRALCNMLDTMAEIHDTYNYKNIKKLTLYLFREIRMTQGISNPLEGATLLRDYIKMSKKLGQEFEKYPKSLKKEHDITSMNYKVMESEIKQKEFTDKVESEDYKSLEMKTKKFSIISPKVMDDLVKEGNELSHCVASYVDSVINSDCKIFFMRETNFLDNPYATIEVRGDRVRQCRGYANRKLSTEEREFIVNWANKKNLVESYYY